MRDDEAVKASDRLENVAVDRLQAVYAEALKKAIKAVSGFLKVIKNVDDGKKKPPAFYNTPEKIKKWREGFTQELIRRENVVDNIMRQIDSAGLNAKDIIKEFSVEVYAVNRDYTVQNIGTKYFSIYSNQQIGIILNDTQPVFSKIAYQSLGANIPIRNRLQNELAQATLLGESQKKIIKRIKSVVDNAQYNAKRVAQTERTRVQSQARQETLDAATAMGIEVTKRWSTRMINSREAHVFLNGKKVAENQSFKVDAAHDYISKKKNGDGYSIRYPGDPNCPARAVINCHCVIVPHVEALPNEN